MLNLISLLKNIIAILIIIIASLPKLHSDDNNVYKQLNLFGEVYERVRSEYVEKISDKEDK